MMCKMFGTTGRNRRRINAFFAAFLVLALTAGVLGFYGVRTQAFTLPETILIGLKFGSTAVETVEITSETGFIVTAGENKIDVPDKTITVKKRAGGGFIIENIAEFENVSELSAMPKEAALVTVFDRQYRGGIVLKRLSESDMTVINQVDFEQYLYSVVGKEMSTGWPIEALKAQAVCARSMAALNLHKFEKYGFNLDDSVASQAYAGVRSEAPDVIAAVEETRGKVVAYNGKPVAVYYFSTSGGWTENSENVWVSALPYLVAVEDKYESKTEPAYANWSVSVTAEEIKQIFAAKGIDIGDITDVSVTEANPVTGRAIKLKFTGTKGEKVYEKDNIRGALGADKLKSQMFTVSKKAGGITFTTGEGAQGAPSLENSDLLASRYHIGTQVSPSESYTFLGHGWGHGVGMSQYGAKGMAEAGFTYEEIIKFYFTGVEII